MRYGEYIKREEDGGQRHREVPYPGKAGTVHCPLEIMCGGIGEGYKQQEGDSKLEKGSLR